MSESDTIKTVKLTLLCLKLSLYSLTCWEKGLRAYWMLHSPTMPRCRMTFSAVVRKRLYSMFVSVWLGATTIDSPVWIPSGSTFSMLHTCHKSHSHVHLIPCLVPHYCDYNKPNYSTQRWLPGSYTCIFAALKSCILTMAHQTDWAHALR